jgi:hypothetical protein
MAKALKYIRTFRSAGLITRYARAGVKKCRAAKRKPALCGARVEGLKHAISNDRI